MQYSKTPASPQTDAHAESIRAAQKLCHVVEKAEINAYIELLEL